MVRFVDQLIADADPTLDLVRVSLTVPLDREPDLAALMASFAKHVVRSPNQGAWLVRDERKGTNAPHVYGLVLLDPNDRDALVDDWCALTGADPNAHRGRNVLKTVEGWTKRANGTRLLRINLLGRGLGHGAVTYGLKDLPSRRARDLDGEDAAVEGALVPAWLSARATAQMTTPPTAASSAVAPKHMPRTRPYPPAARRACLVCGTNLSGKRTDAAVCSDSCRMKRRERGKAAVARNRPSAGALLSLVRALIQRHPSSFSAAEAKRDGERFGLSPLHVARLLRELVKDGVAETEVQSTGRYLLVPGRRPTTQRAP